MILLYYSHQLQKMEKDIYSIIEKYLDFIDED